MNKHFNILQPVSNPVGMKQDEDENVCVYYPSIEGFLVPDPNGYFSAEYILGGIFPAPDAGFEHLFDSQSLSTPYGNTGGFTSADGRFYTNDELAKEAWAHREARHQALEQGDFNIIEVIAALDITQRINNEIANAGGGMMYDGPGLDGGEDGGGRTFPSFSILWLKYPHDINGKHQHPSSDSYAYNQCAIRLGYCLQKSGVDMINYRTGPLTSEGYPRGAKSLADWLWMEFGKPIIVSQEAFESKYWNQNGIIYIVPPRGGIGHIDLFNKGNTGSGYYLGSGIWFWEIK